MKHQPSSDLDMPWMQAALSQAQAAFDAGEVPVGAVVVCDGQVIGTGRNAPIHTHDPSAHAEMIALREAAKLLGNYRLDNCELFVTLEPCLMCAGAMLHARLKRVVFGAADPKTGAAGSVLDVFAQSQLNHHTQVQGGLLADACGQLLQDFFKQQRAQHLLHKAQTGRALREDALRTPENRFADLPDVPKPSRYVNDLPSLEGLRMHYIDAGLVAASQTSLCLHRLGEWSYAWRSLVAQAQSKELRVICPDLIGFGKSDKLKKAAQLTLQWHAQVVQELIERLDLHQISLVFPPDASDLARLLTQMLPDRIAASVPTPTEVMDSRALNAPFPDAGHSAALRGLVSPKIKSAAKSAPTPQP